MTLTLPTADAIRAKQIDDARTFAAVFEAEGVPLASLIAHYVQGTGS